MSYQRPSQPSPTVVTPGLNWTQHYRRGAVDFLFLGLVLLLVTSLSACSTGDANAGDDEDETKQEGKDGVDKEEELPPVEATRVARGPIEAVLRFSTNLEAETEVQVFSQAARQVTHLLVEEGDRVRKGQVLLRLQDDEQRSALARTESQLRKAEKEYERQQNLFNKELISEQAFNDSTYEVEQLQLAVDDAKRNLGYTDVEAPIGGTITMRAINRGDQITVNQLLFDIVDFDSIVARVYVPERELGRLGLKQEARLFADSLDGGQRLGSVLRIAPVVDPKSGTVKVTVAIPSNQGMLPGMYVEVELVTDTNTTAVLLPKRAVIYDNNQSFVYRVKDDLTVEQVFFEVALADRDHVEPRGETIQVGDRIVTAGQAGLKDGIKVRLADGLQGPEVSGASQVVEAEDVEAEDDGSSDANDGNSDDDAVGEDR